jgi:hypothetical protein
MPGYENQRKKPLLGNDSVNTFSTTTGSRDRRNKNTNSAKLNVTIGAFYWVRHEIEQIRV